MSAGFGASVALRRLCLLPVVIHVVHKSAPYPLAALLPALNLEKICSDTTAPMYTRQISMTVVGPSFQLEASSVKNVS